MLRTIARSSLIRSAGIYTASKFVNAAIPFLLLPLMTRFLDPADYGRVAMFSVLTSIAGGLVGINLYGAISVKYFELNRKEFGVYVWNCFLVLLCSFAIVMIVVAVISGPLSRVAAFSWRYVYLVPVLALAQYVIQVALTILQVEQRPVAYCLFQNAQTLVNVALAVLLVVGFGQGWEGPVVAQVVTTGFFAAVAFGWFVVAKRIEYSYNAGYVRHALQFGIPLVPHSLGGVLIVQIDRFFVTNMVGVANTGVYSVGCQLALLVEFIAHSFNQAYVPWLFERLRRNDRLEKIAIVKYTYLYFAGILLLSAAISATMPWFLNVFVGDKFAGAYRYTAWIALGYAFNGMYYMVTNYLFYVGKTAVLSKITLVALLMNVVCNYVLIKANGAVGAAQASAVAFFVIFVSTWVASARAYDMPWGLRSSGGAGIGHGR